MIPYFCYTKIYPQKPIPMSLYDPLLEYEQSLPTKITISRTTQLYSTKPAPSLGHRILRGIRVAGMYCFLSIAIFAVLMGAMNFSAYSARILHWIDPSAINRMAENVQQALSYSHMEVHAAELVSEEILDRAVIEARLALKNPEMVYSHSYSENALLSNIPLTSLEKASFQVTPFENRIIIPRLGQNIPLLDVNHNAGASFTEMHEVFMEELKNGIVRYPGTARPGETGNAFIFGHSSNYPWVKSDYNTVFALLDTLNEGDDIIVYYNQNKYVYRVTDRAVVKPGDVAVLNARDPNKKEISLMTCWPIGTTLERLIIFGELVDTSSLS